MKVIIMIKLTDFIQTPNPAKTKVKFNMNNKKDRAWDLLLNDDPEWIMMNAFKTKQSNNNLNNAEYLISLAQYYPYGPEFFMFGGIYKVEKIVPEVFNNIGYKLVLQEEYQEYIKRLIIKIKEPIGWNSYNRWFETIDNALEPEVYELAPNTKLGHFPGYQNVRIRHKDLQRIINKVEPSWKDALSNVKGVYVITDISNGKLYIGSASGNANGIWQRWASYANLENPTGENKGFKEIMDLHTNEYIINNFQYSILEIFDTKTKQEIIIERENHWKKAFESKAFGMNFN